MPSDDSGARRSLAVATRRYCGRDGKQSADAPRPSHPRPALAAACASPAGPSESPASVAPSDRRPARRHHHGPSLGQRPASAEPAATVMVDTLARTTVGEPERPHRTVVAADLLGALPHPADRVRSRRPRPGRRVHLVSAGEPCHLWVAECGGEIPQFQCTSWVGWAAATTPTGDQWIVPSDPECPPERDTATYLSMDAVTRLACAGDDEWRLVAYIAAPGGRGCMPVWIVDPSWMDPSCAFFFPQPVERELDEDTSLQGFIPPELGDAGREAVRGTS